MTPPNMKAAITNEGTTEGLSKPVPTKFYEGEKAILSGARTATGYTNAELIRRAVRLLGRQYAIGKSYSFLLDLSSPA